MLFDALTKFAFKSPVKPPAASGTPKTGFLTGKPPTKALGIANIPKDLKARTGAAARAPFGAAIRNFGGGEIRKSIGLTRIKKL